MGKSKSAQKQSRKSKVRYFGIVKVKSDAKKCWLSKQDKNGYSLGLALGKRTVWLTGLRFAVPSELDAVLKAKMVIVHLKSKK